MISFALGVSQSPCSRNSIYRTSHGTVQTSSSGVISVYRICPRGKSTWSEAGKLCHVAGDDSWTVKRWAWGLHRMSHGMTFCVILAGKMRGKWQQGQVMFNTGSPSCEHGPQKACSHHSGGVGGGGNYIWYLIVVYKWQKHTSLKYYMHRCFVVAGFFFFSEQWEFTRTSRLPHQLLKHLWVLQLMLPRGGLLDFIAFILWSVPVSIVPKKPGKPARMFSIADPLACKSK